MNYEKSVAELNDILEKLEKGNISMEDSLRLFERGVTLAKECFDYLEQYKGKLTVLKDKLNQDK